MRTPSPSLALTVDINAPQASTGISLRLSYRQSGGKVAGVFGLLVHPADGAYDELEGFVGLFEVVDVAVFEERERGEDDEQADGHLDGQAQEEDVYLRRDAVDDAEEEVCEEQRDHRGRGQLHADGEDGPRHA